MTTHGSDDLDRRRLLRGLCGSAASVVLAGCSSDGATPTVDDEDDDGGDRTDEGTEGTGGDDEEDATPTDSPTDAAETPTETQAAADGTATINLKLVVRESKSNVEKFETLETSFQGLEFDASGGEPARVDTNKTLDLTAVGPGGKVQVVESSVPSGTYTAGSIFMPVADATLADGAEPEFDRTVPASSDFPNPLELSEGDYIEMTVVFGLVRIAGDGPWTYTIGFGWFSRD